MSLIFFRISSALFLFLYSPSSTEYVVAAFSSSFSLTMNQAYMEYCPSLFLSIMSHR